MSALVWIPTAIATAVLMDLWAMLLHGRVWHRWLWSVHASHHRARAGRFEANDLLSSLHAPIAVALIVHACESAKVAPSVFASIELGVGAGMTLFGVSYVLVHDGVVHRRLPVRLLRRAPLLRSVIRAHLVHHSGSEGGVPYGLFFGPLELALHHRRRLKRSRRASAS